MSTLELSQWQQMAKPFEFMGETFCYWASERQDKQGNDKPVLLLIHGFPSASWDWAPIWQTLNQRYHLVAVDMLGFGFSSKNPRLPYSIFTQADLQQALLNHLNIEQYSLLAHDYGDTVAQELLARDQNHRQRQRQLPRQIPHQIQQAFLLNGGLFPETHRALPIQKLMASPFGFLVPWLISKSAFTRSFRRICAQPLSRDELAGLWTLLQHNHGARVMPKLIGYMSERRQHRQRWVGALQQSTVPLVLINGSADPISGAHMVERFRQLIPDQTIIEIAGIGHYPQLEAPQQVSECILQHSLDDLLQTTG